MLTKTIRWTGKSSRRLLRPLRALEARKFNTYEYSPAEQESILKVARATLENKSAVEIQLEEAIMRQEDELAESGILLALTQGVGIVSGLRNASLNSTVDIFDEDHQRVGQGIVLHLHKKRATIAVFGDASPLALGMHVELTDNNLKIPVGKALLGRAINSIGQAVDGKGSLAEADLYPCMRGSIPTMMERGLLKESWETGISVIDCLHPLAFGQRFAVLGPRGSGKTKLAIDMIAQQVKKYKENVDEMPLFAYVAVGKSPQRVNQILQLLRDLGALEYTTVIAADDRQPLIMQYLAPFAGCTIAESWIKQGAKKAVVVYDDLAAHTMVVESLVHAIKLPKAARTSFSGHANLMERCTQFSAKRGGASLSSIVLADTPGKEDVPSAFQESLVSMVDDHVQLDSSLNLRRVYPPVDCLSPGTSVRGPPFQKATLWKCMQHIRATIIDGHVVHENVSLAKGFGLETEPEDQDILDSRELVQQFFNQRPFQLVSDLAITVGAFIIANQYILRLSNPVPVWDVINHVMETMQKEELPLYEALQNHPGHEMWPDALELKLHDFVSTTIHANFSKRK
ncbi:H - or Na -translocating F-type, V-type and A-type ATPase (F-ATPase) Superfamily [Thraustotheca clavata]|uniref:H-or Na-translocating F-type, V-type and A-type ATPase (F-ATPase) Superfamily n=1 Tax=Thraustotheca clavata TaxID=74557 RepID=A0A1V9YZI3_9STRA|nr:H - or Na -translocating F-type, V-type and A-type ATPase (F-ATPase) Superfamily [Thraustotheca clavata]